MKSNAEHWDGVFASTADAQLGWYESDAAKTLQLLDTIPQLETAMVFLPGVGTSVLVDSLLARGSRLVLNDISAEALSRVEKRLQGSGYEVEWSCRDIAQPLEGIAREVDVWVDRAVLHFLTDENDIEGYFANVKTALKPGGHALFAEFSVNGAQECAGLTVHRYSVGELSRRLGSSFQIATQFEHVYTNPYGEPRPYIYTLYRRQSGTQD